ncbi:hypothetical protein GQ44DRAFT_683307 [Phaeosphaeriaceae sp. PMI808]|nr:hypothetical protein GQ44DRAFT_683307 [Phaeosphaeriaceae sp. PMI808]
MHQSIVILSILVSSVMAADTLSFYFPADSEGVDPVATIKSVNPSTTKFNVACPTGVDANDCGWGPGLDYTIMSGTHYQAQIWDGRFSMSFACDHNTKASEMTCTVAMTGGNDDTAGPQTKVLKASEIKFNKATIVQGASLLSGTASMATPAPNAGSMTNAGPTAPTRSTSGQTTQQTGSAQRLSVRDTVLIAMVGLVGIFV